MIWTEKETKLLIDWYNMWSPLGDIAAGMQKPKNAIIGKIFRLRRDPIYGNKFIRPPDLKKSHRKKHVE